MCKQFTFYVFILLLLFYSSCDKNNDSNPIIPVEIDPIASQPTEIKLTIPTISSVQLQWKDNCNWEKQNRIDRRVSESEYTEQKGDWINIARLDKNSTSFIDNNVPFQKFIEYRIYAYYDDEMRSNYGEVSCIIALEKPDSLELIKSSNNSIFLSWKLSYSWIDGFKIERKIDNSDWQLIKSLPSNISQFSDQNLNLDNNHYYRIYTYHGNKTSKNSYVGYIKPKMVLVEGGTFTMGNTWGNRNSNEYPTHEVTLSSFYISKYELTILEWYIFEYGSYNSYVIDYYNYPAYSMFWHDCIYFCNKLSIMEGLTPCYTFTENTNSEYPEVSCNFNSNGYRLPTEAEWEFAARGGNLSHNYQHSGSDWYDEVGWNSYKGPVGQKKANELGIYDMTGNVSEWCWDWYGPYNEDDQIDPKGPSSGTMKVYRGAGLNGDLSSVTKRKSFSLNQTSSGLGVRICRSKLN